MKLSVKSPSSELISRFNALVHIIFEFMLFPRPLHAATTSSLYQQYAQHIQKEYMAQRSRIIILKLTTSPQSTHIKDLVGRAGEPEPEPVGAGCFWLLGAGAGAA